MKLYNTLTRKIEEFTPLHPPKVGMYTCGQTVYDYTHIGHGRKYVNDDILRRSLSYLGFAVTHVQNVTDVGHLVSDADEGEDKLEKGAKKSGKTVWEVADFYTQHFYDSLDKLNILRPTVICKATEHITEQIELIKKLMDKNFAYDTPEAIYFDISKFSDYGKLFGQNLDEKQTVRDDVRKGEHKKHPLDFALWFKKVGRFADHAMHWKSPWGDGFPGWHIECSAMSMKYLGKTIDIHTGGEDHISVHHPNEIAQSEAATGKQFVRFWVHHAFLMVDGRKMSKSLNNFYRVEDIEAKGFEPLALRYLYLTTHYRKQLNFTWESLNAAKEGLNNLRKICCEVYETSHTGRQTLSEEKLAKIQGYSERFKAAIENDLQMPEALAIVWEVAKSNIPSSDKHDLIADFDQVLGLDLLNPQKGYTLKGVTFLDLPEDVRQMIKSREQARKNQDWQLSDQLRDKILKAGYKIEDSPNGPKLSAGNFNFAKMKS
ncbi:cysteine--tRNA ligase [Candidatus Collierbacteria bacterium]|nr:cysteine--tRNA ligase [Candidatus Collierbacteria bacterium]